jgi:hypothetical protein
MLYRIWESFFTADTYLSWQSKLQQSKQIDQAIWDKISDFLVVAEQKAELRNKLNRTDSLKQFLKVAADNGYSFTEDELGWVVITQNQIWGLFELAEKTPSLKEQLLSAKTPNQFISIAAEYGYNFSVQELAWLLTDLKSSSLVRLVNNVGEILTAAYVGRIGTGYWISLGENWGIVPPLCHRTQPIPCFGRSIQDEDISKPSYYLRHCFLPRGYFNQRLINN